VSAASASDASGPLPLMSVQRFCERLS